MLYCGREFSTEEIRWINQVVSENRTITRHRLSRLFCERFDWRKPDGGLKDMSCRVAHLRMDRDGLIRLPPARNAGPTNRRKIQRTSSTEPQPEIRKSAGHFELRFAPVSKGMSGLWNEYIDRYHYLGYTPLPGAQLRYFVESETRIVALLGFGAAAWKTAPRDKHIGWSADQRKRNLHLIVNNARFLILPWFQCKNLASRILGTAARRLSSDWMDRYGYRPVLLETFIEKDRFSGISYKAANGICVGETKGRGKLDVKHECSVPKKTVWLYPLTHRYRKNLCGGNS